jgi:hypothetical protein
MGIEVTVFVAMQRSIRFIHFTTPPANEIHEMKIRSSFGQLLTVSSRQTPIGDGRQAVSAPLTPIGNGGLLLFASKRHASRAYQIATSKRGQQDRAARR